MLPSHLAEKRSHAVLADEAVFTVTRFVIPGVTVLLPQIEACLISTTVVRLNTHFTLVPVAAVHSLISEHGAM